MDGEAVVIDYFSEAVARHRQAQPVNEQRFIELADELKSRLEETTVALCAAGYPLDRMVRVISERGEIDAYALGSYRSVANSLKMTSVALTINQADASSIPIGRLMLEGDDGLYLAISPDELIGTVERMAIESINGALGVIMARAKKPPKKPWLPLVYEQP